MVVIGEVTNRDIVLIDDICDTGGTLCKSAALLLEKGARSVRAFCTHPKNNKANKTKPIIEFLSIPNLKLVCKCTQNLELVICK